MAPFLDLQIERAVAGGRMLARHEGRIVFVHGAIPGERVRARVERRQKQVLFADTVEVLEPSADRRAPRCDLSCGGSSYAHIQYERQRQLKADIVADAFARIAKRPLDAPVPIAGSPERGYRMRARAHVEHGRWGFFREGTHTLCDAGATGQLLPATVAAVNAFVEVHAPLLERVIAMTVSENVDASSRILQLEPADGAPRLAPIDRIGCEGVSGVTTADGETLSGAAWLEDSATALWPIGSPVDPQVTWLRRPASFFQGNRYLLGALVSEVLRASGGTRQVVDLYAGGGLFSVALAARGARVAAVEVEESSARDLADNARPFGESLVPIFAPVESVVGRRPPFAPDTVVLDPPRTGASAEALAGLIAWATPRLVYVSCDPPTLARDCRRLLAAGYRLTSLTGFDLFPNTPHIEVVAVLER